MSRKASQDNFIRLYMADSKYVTKCDRRQLASRIQLSIIWAQDEQLYALYLVYDKLGTSPTIRRPHEEKLIQLFMSQTTFEGMYVRRQPTCICMVYIPQCCQALVHSQSISQCSGSRISNCFSFKTVKESTP